MAKGKYERTERCKICGGNGLVFSLILRKYLQCPKCNGAKLNGSRGKIKEEENGLKTDKVSTTENGPRK